MLRDGNGGKDQAWVSDHLPKPEKWVQSRKALLWAEAGTSRCHCKERRGPGGCLRPVLVKIELACVPTAKSPSLVIYKAGSRRVYKCFCVRDV